LKVQKDHFAIELFFRAENEKSIETIEF